MLKYEFYYLSLENSELYSNWSLNYWQITFIILKLDFCGEHILFDLSMVSTKRLGYLPRDFHSNLTVTLIFP